MNEDPNRKVIWTGASPRGWHRLQLASECLQKYAWEYHAPQRPAWKSPALAKGSLVHLALAQHYARMRARQRDAAEALARDDCEDDWCESEEAVSLISRVEKVESYAPLALRAYQEYKNVYLDDEMRWRVLEVESLLQTMIGGRYLLTGRADLVVEDEVGNVYVVDHKTTSRITSAHKQFYAVSGQLIGYSHMAREKYGDRFAGLIVNLIQLGTEFAFDRVSLPRSPNMEARFEQTVIDIEESIARMESSGRAFDDWPKAMSELVCYTRYGPCQHIDQCRHGAGSWKAGNWTWTDK